MYLNILLIATIILTSVDATYYTSSEEENSILSLNEKSDKIQHAGTHESTQFASADPNQEFWETLHQTSMFNTRKTYNVPNNEKVCFTCPIDREIFTSLYHEASTAVGDTNQIYGQKMVPAPPRVSISWATEMSENRLIFFCRNNTKITTSPIHLSSDYDTQMGGNDLMQKSVGDSQLDYTCENNRLCLLNAKNNYPHMYKCYVKSYVLNVKLNVIVQLQYMQLYFTGDSVKFDYQKEVQVHENQMFTMKCEVPESNPVSHVAAYIDSRELKLSKLEKKSIDNQMSINTYWYEINATRAMNGKRVKCEAKMKDLPDELANTLDLRSHISKEYDLSVHYLPTCVYPKRGYRAGINRTIILECPINGSNPDVNHYKVIPPSPSTKFDLIDQNFELLKKVGRFRVTPKSQADFGLYECIPRSSAGVTRCEINLELGDTPNPPEECSVQFAAINNKTFAQFSCKPGHNQGGSSSFLSIYERTNTGNTVLSGRVNIADDSMMSREVSFITPADQEKYYEFLLYQENNYGNSTPVFLTLGVSQKAKASFSLLPTRTIYAIAAGAAIFIFVVFICACCCCSDLFGSSSKGESGCCKWCCGSSSDNMDEESLNYKKKPIDLDDHMDHLNNNQSFPAYSSSESTSSLTNGKLNAQSYDYYDNTSTGLLEHDHYARNNSNHYQKSLNIKSTRNGQTKIYETRDDAFNKQSHYDRDNEEPYMNDGDELPPATITHSSTLKKNFNNKRIVVVNNKQYTYDNDDNNEDTNMNSGDHDTSLSGSNSLPKSGSGGSGIDSSENGITINSNASATHTTTRVIKPPPVPKQTLTNSTAIFNNNVCVALGSGVESINKRLNSTTNNYVKSFKPNGKNNNMNANYSSVDSKNLKFIKTDNGLVYTPINYTNIDRHVDEEDYEMGDDDEERDVDIDDDEQEQTIQELNEEEEIREQKIKKLNNNHTYNGTKRQTQQQLHPAANNHFQNELSIRLKSINHKDSSSSSTLTNSNLKNENQIYSKNYHHTSNGLANGGLKISSSNNSTATTSISSASSTSSNSDSIIGTSNTNKRTNENYSLLKTTLNSNNNPQVTLAPSLTINHQLNVPALPAQKPPILKPKPKTTNIYATATHADKNDLSLHNRSTEPLLNHTINNQNQTTATILSSFNTSPSTSITDVSSNNCTPQHNLNGLELDTPISCNIVKHTTFGNGAITTKVTTTTTTNAPLINTSIGNGGFYDSVNLLNGTLGRNKTTPNGISIDDEIMAVKNSNGSFVSKTLERRHVKNSEC